MRNNSVKVLVIGGTGFLGTEFCIFLKKKNFQVISLSRKKPKTKNKLDKVKYIHADLSKKKELFKKLDKLNNINYVINFGGEVDHKNSNKVYRSHFLGVKFLAEYFLKSDISKFLQVGSSMEYGHYKSPQKEKINCNPISNYGKAKYLATKLLISLNLKHNFPVIIVRPYQIYGPRQTSNRLIPYVIKSCIKNLRFPCSHGKQQRDFLYISDFLKAIFNLMQSNKKTNGQIFNIGYGKPFNIKKIIKIIRNKVQKGQPIFGAIKMRKEEKLKTYPDIRKIYKFVKWKPKISFFEGLTKTIKYYQ